MIPRAGYQALMKLAGQFPVVLITGPRQSGKTKLALAAFPKKKYISFMNKNYRDLAKSNPSAFLEEYPDGVIIDDAQLVPEIVDALKKVVSSGKHAPGKYILLSPNQIRTRQNIEECLAGKIGVFKLMPLSIQEISKADLLPDDLYDITFIGFYPPFYDVDKLYLQDNWLEYYVSIFMNADVKDKINDSNLPLFRRFMQACAPYSGKVIDYDGIAKEVGITTETAKIWCSILVDSYIVYFVEPDNNNLGRTIAQTPKFYFLDTGLLCYLLGMETIDDLLKSEHKEAILETVAVSELLKRCYTQAEPPRLTYFRDKNGFEVGLVAGKKCTDVIEITSSTLAEKEQTADIRHYIKQRSDRTKAYVYYLGDSTCDMNGVRFTFWKEWGNLESVNASQTAKKQNKGPSQ